MKPEENQKGKTYPGNDSPYQNPVKPELELLGHPTLDDKRVERPQNGISEHEIGDRLPRGFRDYLIPRDGGPSDGFPDEGGLHRGLDQLNQSHGQNHDVPFLIPGKESSFGYGGVVVCDSHGADHDPENGVQLNPGQRDGGKDFVQRGKAPSYGGQLPYLHQSDEVDKSGYPEYREERPGREPKESVHRKSFVFFDHEEYYDDDRSRHEAEEPEEKSLAGSAAIHPPGSSVVHRREGARFTFARTYFLFLEKEPIFGHVLPHDKSHRGRYQTELYYERIQERHGRRPKLSERVGV